MRTYSWTKNEHSRNARISSHEERVKAIQLFLKFDCSYTGRIRDLVYPSVAALCEWYKEYLKSGKITHNQKIRKKYTEEQKRHAVNHYLE